MIRNGKLAGAILLGDTRKVATLTQFFDRQSPLPEERALLLFDIGKGTKTETKALPDDTKICNCNGVSAGQIRSCIISGASELGQIMGKTGAGTGCGSCKSLVREFL